MIAYKNIPCKHFNSIKVRLEPFHPYRNIKEVTFQFHKGTIRTVQPNMASVKSIQFQFHKGTIRTSMDPFTGAAITLFQFHKGTIRTA